MRTMHTQPRIEPVLEQDISEILTMKWQIFGKYYSNRDECDSYTLAYADWKRSVKLTYDARIVGMYLLRAENISEVHHQAPITLLYEDLLRYRDLHGIQGVTLGLQEMYRGRGWGNILKEYPKALGYDYWWGIAFKALGNLRDWQKRARLVGECEDSFLLLEDFSRSSRHILA